MNFIGQSTRLLLCVLHALTGADVGSGDADGQAAKLAFVSDVLPRLRTVDIPRDDPSWAQVRPAPSLNTL